jgi:3-isopropylmalate/(R)-2-methylmalate dehydratase small subunit
MAERGGRVWKFGDEINTDVMAPGQYFKLPVEEAIKHCLEAVDPAFAPSVQPGDIVVAGRNFGVGSSREQAAMAFRSLQVGALLAVSFARIFYRNLLNLGVPALVMPEAHEIMAGDQVHVDPVAGRIQNVTQGKHYRVEPIPAHLMEMIESGGLMPYLKNRIARENKHASR